MLAWFIYFFIKESILAKSIYDISDICEFYLGFLSFWNTIDFMRIGSILYFGLA
jgi:hypothetical protein